MVTMTKPLHAICMLLLSLAILLTSTYICVAQRTNSSLEQPLSAFSTESGSRPVYKDAGLSIINGNPADANSTNIESIVNSAFDDVDNSSTNGNRNSTSKDEGALNTNSNSNTGDGGFSASGLSTKNTAINSDIPPPEDKQRTLDVVRQAHQNLLEPVIKTNKSNAFLSCETGEMIVKINFTEPFRGVAYADYDRSSPCKFSGDGGDYYELRLPLKGCGTKQEAPRLFLNNIIVRYHRMLELEEDEIKTIVCRYPPPLAPSPPPPPIGPPEKIIDSPPEPAKLTQYEPLVIIAGLLFLALTLLGLGASSYLVKRQNIKPIHTPLPPPPLTGLTEYETYMDNQSIITTEDLDIIHKNTLLYAQPHLDTQYIDDTFVTTIHEIDTHDDIVHHTDTRYFRPVDVNTANIEDTFITNEENITTKDVDTFTKTTPVPRYLVKNIEDTFMTKVDEIDEIEQISTMHNKKMRKSTPISTTTTTATDETLHEDDHKTTNKMTTNNNAVVRPIKSKLTTTEQFRHLQNIVDLFDETYTTSETTSGFYSATNTVSSTMEKDNIIRRFGSRISRMPHYDKTTLRSLLLDDDTFRSLVMDTTSDEALIPTIRRNPDYTNKITIDTWNLFEEILTETHHTYRQKQEYTLEESSYEESTKLHNYEPIGQQQLYYNYDHIKQLPMLGHVADPDFDSRTYTKSSCDSESHDNLSPEPERRRIKGRREKKPSHMSESWQTEEQEEQQYYRTSKRPGASVPSLLSDPDLQPQTFDGSEVDTASLPDYGDNLFDEPASSSSFQRNQNQPSGTKDVYNQGYNNRAYLDEEEQHEYYATATSSYPNRNRGDDYRNKDEGSRRRPRQRNGSPQKSAR